MNKNLSYTFFAHLGSLCADVLLALYKYTFKFIVFEHCLFHPTCSVYMRQAIHTHGLKGVWLGLKRLARCHPWRKVSAFYDPIPPVSEAQLKVYSRKDIHHGY